MSTAFRPTSCSTTPPVEVRQCQPPHEIKITAAYLYKSCSIVVLGFAISRIRIEDMEDFIFDKFPVQQVNEILLSES